MFEKSFMSLTSSVTDTKCVKDKSSSDKRPERQTEIDNPLGTFLQTYKKTKTEICVSLHEHLFCEPHH